MPGIVELLTMQTSGEFLNGTEMSQPTDDGKKWLVLSAMASTGGCLFNGVMAVCAGLSVWFLFTQTPLYEGSRPHLTYFIERSNTKVKDDSGYFESSIHITLTNHTRYAAKDVYIVVQPLDGENFHVSSQFHIDEIAKGEGSRRFLLLKTVPALTVVHVTCRERVESFKAGIDWGLALGGGDDLDEQVGKHFYYFGSVEKVYTEHGEVIEQQHLSKDRKNLVAEDYGSNEGKKRKEALREKLKKDGKLPPVRKAPGPGDQN